MKKLTIVRIQECVNNNGEKRFMLKLQNKDVISVETALGTFEQDTQETYYIFLSKLAKGVAPNQVIDFDISLFDIKERAFTFTNDDGEVVNATLKYLVAKRP